MVSDEEKKKNEMAEAATERLLKSVCDLNDLWFWHYWLGTDVYLVRYELALNACRHLSQCIQHIDFDATTNALLSLRLQGIEFDLLRRATRKKHTRKS